MENRTTKPRLLESLEEALRRVGRPLSAKELVSYLDSDTSFDVGGQTPWKTIGARLATDIRSNETSPFVRAGSGLYGLREWRDVVHVDVPVRRINPLEEDILAVPSQGFREFLSRDKSGALLNVHYTELLNKAEIVPRTQAEASEEWVQLIPSFLVFRDNEVLAFKRTKKTPESRLHDSYSVVFGGHLQAEDQPSLFLHDEGLVEEFLFRELREELSFDPEFRSRLYAGVLYLTGSAFERQHAGVVFVIDLEPGTHVSSEEPGYQTSLHFIPWNGIEQSKVMEDRWSEACVRHLRGNT